MIIWTVCLVIAGLIGMARRVIRREYPISLVDLFPSLTTSGLVCGIVGWQIGLAFVGASDGAIFGALAGVLGGLFVLLNTETLEWPKLR